MLSSSRGWRSTIAAASAPANPAAPRTATLCTERTIDLIQRFLDRRAGASHILISEGAQRRAELEPQRERFAPLADLLAAVHVEELDPVEQLARSGTHDALDLRGRHFLPDHDGDVLDHGWEARDVAVRLGTRREFRDQVGVELEG